MRCKRPLRFVRLDEIGDRGVGTVTGCHHRDRADVPRAQRRPAAAARSGVTDRGLDCSSTNPTKSAPAATAAATSSGRVSPQILTSTLIAAPPPRARVAAPGCASGRCRPARRRRPRRGRLRRPARLSIPDSAIRRALAGSDAINRCCRAASISIVCRSRALTPITAASRPTARSHSAASCTSTTVSMPSSPASSISLRASASLTIARITRIASAPARRWAATCSGNSVKSLASAGSGELARASVRCSRLPPKSRAVHSTDIAAAPDRAYSAAVPAMLASGAIAPWEGEARLTSAITATWVPALSAAAKPRVGTGGAVRSLAPSDWR